MATRKPKIYISHNPNILANMHERSAEELVKGWWMRGDDTEEQKKFPFEFEALYKEAVEHVNTIDTKGVLAKAFGILPIAPRLDFVWGNEQPEAFPMDKFGGIPDFRDAIGYDAFIAEKYPDQWHKDPSPEKTLLRRWPIGPDGQRMLFVGEFTVPSHIAATFDYFMHEKIKSRYSDRHWIAAPFDTHLVRDFNPMFSIRIRVFKTINEFFESAQMDALVMLGSFIDKEDNNLSIGENAPEIMSAEEYIALVKKLIPSESFTETTRPIITRKLGFDLDDNVWEILGAPKFELDWKLNDKLREGPLGRSYGDCINLFGEPRSQQMAKRYYSPNSCNGLRRMTPFVHWHEVEHDMDHQIYLPLPGHSEVWGKNDASCT